MVYIYHNKTIIPFTPQKGVETCRIGVPTPPVSTNIILGGAIRGPPYTIVYSNRPRTGALSALLVMR